MLLLSVSFFFAFNFFTLFAKDMDIEKRPTICLNMIVKNESKIICRCLESMLPIIDYWVIVDTGSDDGTQKIIKDFMKSKNAPGELHERPWKSFSHNRNEALQLADKKADYIFFIDADEYLSFAQGFTMPKLDKDYYYASIDLDSQLLYKRIQLISTKNPWKWDCDIHEVLVPTPGMTHGNLDGVTIISTRDGARDKDPLKYEKDIAILEKALEKEPNSTRYTFYLAQTYKDAGKKDLSLKYYQKRIDMGGWEEEVFWSKLQVAILQEQINAPQETIINAYKDAYLFRPRRAEPLYYLANYFRSIQDFKSCYEIAKIGMAIPMPQDVLFIQKWIYEYGLTLECSVGAYWTGFYRKCKDLSLKIIETPNIPAHVRECVIRNLGFANIKLIEKVLPNNLEEKPAA